MERLRRLIDESPWLAFVLPLTALSLGFHLLLVEDFDRGRVIWDAWRHRPGNPWAWVPFVHPPAYTEFLRAVEAGALAAGTTPERLSLLLSAPCFAALVPLSAACVRAADPEGSGRGLVLAASLAALSPGLLRPFEDYPLAAVLVTAGLFALLAYARTGGLLRFAASALLVFAAVELHLSAWFVLGPALVALVAVARGRRLGFAGLTLGTVGAFLATTLVPEPGLWGLFDHPHAYFQEGRRFGELNLADPNIEWTNPLLFAALLPWLLPSVARRRPLGAALALALAAYTAITLGLMTTGLAISGPRSRAHHYFELIDPALAVCAVLVLGALAEGSRTATRHKAVLALAGLLLGSQLFFFADGRVDLGRVARAPWLWEQPVEELRLDGFGEVPAAWIHVELDGPDPAWILRTLSRVEVVISPEAPLVGLTGRPLTTEALPAPWSVRRRADGTGPSDLVVELDLGGLNALPSTGLAPGPNLPIRFRAQALGYDAPSGGQVVAASSVVGPLELRGGDPLFVRLLDIASTAPTCGDGEDNDGDGWPDQSDPDCARGTDGFERGGLSPHHECNDGLDNDGDGGIDARDRHCDDGYDDELP